MCICCVVFFFVHLFIILCVVNVDFCGKYNILILLGAYFVLVNDVRDDSHLLGQRSEGNVDKGARLDEPVESLVDSGPGGGFACFGHLC